MFSKVTKVISAIAFVLVLAGSAKAETMQTTDSGYTFMGGGMGYAERNYALAGPLSNDSMWGYSWLKFDNMPEEQVSSAILTIESLYQAPGMFSGPSETNPVQVGVYAVTADVSGITDGTYTLAEFRSNYISLSSVVLNTVTTTPGTYEWDITDIVNSWVASGQCLGLIIANASSDTEDLSHFKYAALAREGLSQYGDVLAAAPTIEYTTGSPSAVPEPSTVALMVFGGIGLVAARRKKS